MEVMVCDLPVPGGPCMTSVCSVADFSIARSCETLSSFM